MEVLLGQIADRLLSCDNWTDVNLAAIGPRLAPHIFILGIERDSDNNRVQLRIRLVGTALDKIFGRPLRGSLLEDFMHGPRSRDVLEAFHDCAKTREPLWMRQVVHIAGNVPRFVEGIVVHLKPDRLYGGLAVGEIPDEFARPGFERAALSRLCEPV